jgi:hypothetical protein
VRALARDRGQAAVELLAGLPVLLGLGVALAQLLAVGYSALLAGNAAEAGALAVAARADAAASARNALPGWTRAAASVQVRGGRVTVRVRPPSLLPVVGRALEVVSTASVVR